MTGCGGDRCPLGLPHMAGPREDNTWLVGGMAGERRCRGEPGCIQSGDEGIKLTVRRRGQMRRWTGPERRRVEMMERGEKTSRLS